MEINTKTNKNTNTTRSGGKHRERGIVKGRSTEEEIYSVLSYARMKGVRGFVIICKYIEEFSTLFRLCIEW